MKGTKYVLLLECKKKLIKVIMNYLCAQKKHTKQEERIRLGDSRTLQNKTAETIF